MRNARESLHDSCRVLRPIGDSSYAGQSLSSYRRISLMMIDNSQWADILSGVDRIRWRRRTAWAIMLLSLPTLGMVGEWFPGKWYAVAGLLWMLAMGMLSYWWQASPCPRCGHWFYNPAQGGYSNPLASRCRTCGLSLNPRVAAKQLREQREQPKSNAGIGAGS